MAPNVTKVADKPTSDPKLKKSINKENLKSSTKLVQNSFECLRIKCPICYDNISKDSVSSTKCGHVFCTTCLVKALKRLARCPLCQTRLTRTRGHHPLYLDTYISETEMDETKSDVIVLG